MSEPKSAWDSRDTSWDDYHRKNGLMTNKEFFSSNAAGGFYEGMEWDGDEWVPDAASREREAQTQREKENELCDWCGERMGAHHRC